eukprot:scaffold300516_cov19-Tisochrysis_lutea.AAC.1
MKKCHEVLIVQEESEHVTGATCKFPGHSGTYIKNGWRVKELLLGFMWVSKDVFDLFGTEHLQDCWQRCLNLVLLMLAGHAATQ